jgi:transposase-like protein
MKPMRPGRAVIKTRGSFANNDAALKLVYLAI